MSRCHRRHLRILAFTLLAPALAPAATVTWDAGGGSGQWGTAANWNPDTTLATGDFLLFGASGTTALTNGTTANNSYGLTFNSGAAAYTIGGNAITLDATYGIANNASAAQILNTPFVLGATAAISAASGPITLGGAVTGSGGLTKSGASTLTLTGAGSYSGATSVTDGTLKLVNNTSFASAVAVGTGAFLEFNSTAANDTSPDWNYNKTLTGAGTVNKTGTGWVYWPGTISLTGQINVTDGILSSGLGTSVWTANTASLNVASPGKFDIYARDVTIGALTGNGVVQNGNNTGAYTLTVGAAGASGSFNGTIQNTTGSLVLTKTGAGTQTFSGTATHSGLTTVNGGLLDVTGGSINGTLGLITQSGGAISIANASLTIPASGSGVFGVGYAATGTGTVTIGSGAAVSVGNSARAFVGGGNGAAPFGDGVLNINAGGSLTVGTGGTFPNERFYFGGYGGNGTLNLTGGTLTSSRDIVGANGSRVFNLNAGTIKAGFTSATFLSGMTTVNLLAGGVILDSNGFGMGVSQAFSGAGAITKNGAGTLTMSAGSTYSGGTVLNAGTLAAGHVSGLGTGPVTLNAGTLNSGGFSIANNLVSPSGTIASVVTTASETLGGTLTGSGRVNFSTTTTSQTVPFLPVNMSGFTGTIGVDTSLPGNSYFPGVNTTSGGQIKWVVTGGGSGTGNGSGSFLFNTSGTPSLGELSGNGRIGSTNSGTTIWSIGALNTDSTFSGTIMNNFLGGGGVAGITKVGTGTLTLSGPSAYSGLTTVSAGTLTLASTGSLVLAGGLAVNGASAVADIQGTVTTSGTTANPFDVKNGGVLNYSGTGTISNGSGGAMLVGSGSPGTLNMTGGTLSTTFANTNGWGIGFQANGDGTVNLTGGTLTAATNNEVFYLGYGATNAKGVFNVSGTGVLNIGAGGGPTFIGGGASGSGQYGTGTMTIGAGGVVNATAPGGAVPNDRIYLAGYGGNGTLNLNAGGTLATERGFGKGGNGTFNLNGGTLRALATSTDFIRFDTRVLSGGAVLDTNGFNLTLNWPLVDGGGGGGLTKNGAGTLTLSTTNGSSTFTGPIQVNAGVLKASGGTGALPANVTVASGASLDVNGVNFGALRDATVSGTGAAGQVGALVNTSASTEGFIRNLTLSGPATIGTSNAKLNVGGTLNGGGNTLTIAGTGQTNIRANNALTNLAGVQVNSGVFRLESSQAPASAFAITVNSGAILDTYDNRTQGANLGLVLNGGTLGSEGPAGTFTGTWNGPVSVTAASSVNPVKDIVLNGVLSGIGALAKNGAGSLTLGNTASTYTGPISVNAGTLRVNSGTEQSLGANPGAPVANQLFLNGGTLRVDTASLAIDDANRGVSVGLSGGTFLVDTSVSLTLGTSLSAGVGGSTTTKAGAGTFNLTADNSVNALVVAGGVIRQVSGLTSVLTTSTGLDIRNGGTYRLEGGVLRSDRIQVQTGGTFVWGAASLGQLTTNGSAGTTDYSGPGFQSVSSGVTANFQGSLATSAGSTLLMHGSPSLYLNNGVRFNNWALTGDLDLSSPGDTLEFALNPYLLRPFSSAGIGAIETGSLPLITWGGAFIGGEFENVTGIVPQGAGFSEYAFSVSDPNDLDPNTWSIEYDAAAKTVWLHYKVTGYVPEPAGFTLLAAAVAGLRLMRRLGSLRGRLDGAVSAG